MYTLYENITNCYSIAHLFMPREFATVFQGNRKYYYIDLKENSFHLNVVRYFYYIKI